MPDSSRLPPGQVLTKKWPVLHYGNIPRLDLATWRLRVWGAVEHPYEPSWQDFQAAPHKRLVCDIHCVTNWSRFDNEFEGVPVRFLLEQAVPSARARFALIHAAPAYTTNLPLTDLDRPGNLVVDRFAGQPLPPEHGGPARLLVPHLYLWKSAKWITGIELLEEDEPGFWEQNGYHMRGDPWTEERYGRAEPARMRRGPRS
jgi:DMSO/TMAO reductase YedYZ molybdopterin-dependent catalytic subunit